MEKQCRQCLEVKPLTEFYTHPMMKDGHLNKCKPCVKARVAVHRDNHLDSIREYDRSRSSKPHRKKARKEYLKRYRKENPEKRAAHAAVSRAVRKGTLIPQPCEVCGSVKSEAHHPDYLKPLEVQWLCSVHHKAVHFK